MQEPAAATSEQWIIEHGNTIDGYTYTGTFPSKDQAEYWASMWLRAEEGFTVNPLTAP